MMKIKTVKTLERAWEIARSEGLKYVYIGNIPMHSAENTYCPGCNKKLIVRQGYYIAENYIIKGACKFCGYAMDGRWDFEE